MKLYQLPSCSSLGFFEGFCGGRFGTGCLPLTGTGFLGWGLD
ncbi:hypothetical protein BLA29_015545 [Euroglyphus maynei]|uniref:Uncharacterized protein n=1 Tax=Euroglyphus maynei TaxID=6958 RepID=A0A1Y3BJ81_EURMA|nr:hypothetical protein BLA29_015545 [Euroglyphus maynei]